MLASSFLAVLRRSLCLILFALGCGTVPLSAVILDVTLTDFDGPVWTGQVDTTADTFILTSWTENTGGAEFWTASSLPIVLTAEDANGTFDVPDDWDGTIDNSWAFVGPILDTLSWNEGTFNLSQWTIGWGGGRANGTLQPDSIQLQYYILPQGASAAGAGFFDEVSVVPEPRAWALLVLGAVGLLIVRRRR